MSHDVLKYPGVILSGGVYPTSACRVFDLFSAFRELFLKADLRSRQAQSLRPQTLDTLEDLPLVRPRLGLPTPSHRKQPILPFRSKRKESGILHAERAAEFPLQICLVLLANDRGEHESKPFGSVPIFVVCPWFERDGGVDQILLL